MIVTSLALDPIEKKPLAAFAPGARILSVGSIGCTMHCPWCQNHDIAQPETAFRVPSREMSANELVEQAEELIRVGNIGIAYTYNEPLLRWKDVLECAKIAHEHGLVNVMVTNGAAPARVIDELRPFINAWNIDLKASSQRGYDICGCRIEDVKRTIELANKADLSPFEMKVPFPNTSSRTWPHQAHVEVTTLVIPGFNDTDDDFECIASWIASNDKSIVWHVTRFFPRFKYSDRHATPLETLERAKTIGTRYLDTVVLGNV